MQYGSWAEAAMPTTEGAIMVAPRSCSPGRAFTHRQRVALVFTNPLSRVCSRVVGQEQGGPLCWWRQDRLQVASGLPAGRTGAGIPRPKAVPITPRCCTCVAKREGRPGKELRRGTPDKQGSVPMGPAYAAPTSNAHISSTRRFIVAAGGRARRAGSQG